MANTVKQTSFSFVNVSHPDELKDADVVYYIRHKAMTHCGKLKKKKNPKDTGFKLVFELEPDVLPPEGVMLSAAGVGLGNVDHAASHIHATPAHASGPCSFFDFDDGHSEILRSACQSVDLHNEILFRLLLSKHALNREKLCNGKLMITHTMESLELYNEAIQLMHRRLDDPRQHTSDDVIASMAGFLTFDRLVADWVGWELHMDGLLGIMQLQGGFGTMSGGLQILLSWTDIGGCFSRDIPPHLPLPAAWLREVVPSAHESLLSKLSPICKAWREEFPDVHEWRTAFERLSFLVLYSGKPASMWMEPIIYCLLSMRPTRFDITLCRASVIEAVCRAGALLFLAPIWRSCGNLPIRTTMIRHNLLLILNAHLAEWGQLRGLLLWTLAHAAREAEDDFERSDFVVRLSMIMNKMGITTWEGLMQELRGILWMEESNGCWDAVEEAWKVTVHHRLNSDGHGRIKQEGIPVRSKTL